MFGVNIEKMRDALRNERSSDLERRRRIALLSALGLVDFSIISLHQMGVIRHLPDLPGKIFDSDKVNASHKAYQLGVPDGTTGATLYAFNLVLASFGGTRKTGRHPVFTYLLGASAFIGAAGAIQYLYDMAKKQQRACPYCITGAVLNFFILRDAIGEMRESSRSEALVSQTRRRAA